MMMINRQNSWQFTAFVMKSLQVVHVSPTDRLKLFFSKHLIKEKDYFLVKTETVACQTQQTQFCSNLVFFFPLFQQSPTKPEIPEPPSLMSDLLSGPSATHWRGPTSISLSHLGPAATGSS